MKFTKIKYKVIECTNSRGCTQYNTLESFDNVEDAIKLNFATKDTEWTWHIITVDYALAT